MNICVIQAREGATRLPSKVLKKMIGKPMIQHVIERVQRSKFIDEIIITTLEKDHKLNDLLDRMNVDRATYNIPENNVLERFTLATDYYSAGNVIRITGDCPLICPKIIDRTIQAYLDSPRYPAYATSRPHLPSGFDVEVFPLYLLREASNRELSPYDREHVTPYIKRNITNLNVVFPFDLGEEHWSVDTLEDFKKVEQVFEHFGNNKFSVSDMRKYIEDVVSNGIIWPAWRLKCAT